MQRVVRVLEDYDSSTNNYILLDKPYYTRPTKLTDGVNILEVMYCISSDNNKHYYRIRNMFSPYKWKWLCGTILTEISPTIKVTKDSKGRYSWHEYNTGLEVHDITRSSIMVKDLYDIFYPNDNYNLKSLYSEEELVPPQYFGFNDYLKCKTWHNI